MQSLGEQRVDLASVGVTEGSPIGDMIKRHFERRHGFPPQRLALFGDAPEPAGATYPRAVRYRVVEPRGPVANLFGYQFDIDSGWFLYGLDGGPVAYCMFDLYGYLRGDSGFEIDPPQVADAVRSFKLRLITVRTLMERLLVLPSLMRDGSLLHRILRMAEPPPVSVDVEERMRSLIQSVEACGWDIQADFSDEAIAQLRQVRRANSDFADYLATCLFRPPLLPVAYVSCVGSPDFNDEMFVRSSGYRDPRALPDVLRSAVVERAIAGNIWDLADASDVESWYYAIHSGVAASFPQGGDKLDEAVSNMGLDELLQGPALDTAKEKMEATLPLPGSDTWPKYRDLRGESLYYRFGPQGRSSLVAPALLFHKAARCLSSI